MAKDSIRLQAETLYIHDCLTAKEIAKRLSVSEKTLGAWVEKYNWKARKLSKHTTPEVFIQKYDELLGALLDKRLKFEKDNNVADDEYKGLIDEMSKLSALREKLLTDGKLSLGTHVRCIERFMQALNKQDVKLFMQLLDFNKQYFNQLAEDLR